MTATGICKIGVAQICTRGEALFFVLTGSELSELERSVQQLCRSALCIGAEDIEPLLNSLTTTTAKLGAKTNFLAMAVTLFGKQTAWRILQW